MNVRYRVTLSSEERAQLQALVQGGKGPVRRLKRAQVLLPRRALRPRRRTTPTDLRGAAAARAAAEMPAQDRVVVRRRVAVAPLMPLRTTSLCHLAARSDPQRATFVSPSPAAHRWTRASKTTPASSSWRVW